MSTKKIVLANLSTIFFVLKEKNKFNKLVSSCLKNKGPWEIFPKAFYYVYKFLTYI